MAQIGSILREARVRMGLNLKQVSEITKIRVKYLEALEEDDFKAIPGPTFIKAYLRTYASVMRLDADSLVEEYRSSYERRKSSQSEYYDLTLEQMRSRTMRGRKKRPVQNTRRGYTVVGIMAIVAVVLLAYFGSNRGQGEARIVQGTTTSTTQAAPAVSTTTVPGGVSATTTTIAVYTGNDVTLKIVATGVCHLVIRENDSQGKEIWQGALKSGEEKLADTAKRYYVDIGAPDAIRIYINGILYPSPTVADQYYISETRIELVQ